MGGMVKGKGGEWEERTDTIMQVLRTICLKCKCRLYFISPIADKSCDRKMVLHYSTLPHSLILYRSSVNTLFTCSSPLLHLHQACRQTPSHRSGILSHSYTRRTLWIGTVSSFLLVGIAGGRLQS